jgi:molybdate transport system substrate-binding protein
MFKKIFIIAILIVSNLYAKTIKVAISANVSYAINDLIKEFNRINPNIKVQVTLGGSGKLVAQIRHNAPYHIFMSADMNYPNALYKDKIAITKPKIYAQGALSYFSIKQRDFSMGLDLLKDKNIRRIAVANPKTAPYGKATKEALENAKLYKLLKNKFVYGESISQTVSYTITATDIGFIASSSLYSKSLEKYKKGINWQEVELTLYNPINQGIVILKNGKENKDVKKFYDFILSDSAKEIFKRFGYIVS